MNVLRAPARLHDDELCNMLDQFWCWHVGGCQNYGPFLGPYYNTAPNIFGYPKRDHSFDNHPCVEETYASHLPVLVVYGLLGHVYPSGLGMQLEKGPWLAGTWGQGQLGERNLPKFGFALVRGKSKGPLSACGFAPRTCRLGWCASFPESRISIHESQFAKKSSLPNIQLRIQGAGNSLTLEMRTASLVKWANASLLAWHLF